MPCTSHSAPCIELKGASDLVLRERFDCQRHLRHYLCLPISLLGYLTLQIRTRGECLECMHYPLHPMPPLHAFPYASRHLCPIRSLAHSLTHRHTHTTLPHAYGRLDAAAFQGGSGRAGKKARECERRDCFEPSGAAGRRRMCKS